MEAVADIMCSTQILGSWRGYMSKSRLAVDREFMYIIGSAGRADGRTDGGRTILNDSITIFIVF